MFKKNKTAIMAGVISSLMAVNAMAERFVFIDEARMEQSRNILEEGKASETLQQSYDRLLEEAALAMVDGPFSVTDKGMTPPSGSKNDYLSLSPYWWPDENKEDGLPWIRHDGRTNPASKTNASDSVRVGHFTRSVRALALAYYFSGDEQYAERAIDYVRTWYLNPETRMNPNVDFGQGVPGVADGRRGGIIDTRSFADRMLDSFAILAQSDSWTDTDQTQLDNWFGDYLDWLQTSELGIGESNSDNNHGTWYDLQVAAIAYYLGEHELAKTMVENGKVRLEVQLNEKGEQPHELERTRTYHYSYFNLDAFAHIAQIGDKVGVDLWNYEAANGASLEAGIQLLVDYQDSSTEWPWAERGEPRRLRMLPVYRKAAIAWNDEKLMDLSAEGDFSDMTVKSNLAEVWSQRDLELLYPVM